MAILRPERWKPIPGYGGLYSVSDRGRVFSERRRRHLKLSRDSDGYRVVSLPQWPGKKVIKVHRLVLEAFVGPCPRGQQALHRNGQRGDNRLTNLRWGTPLENAADRQSAEGYVRGARHHNAKLDEAGALRIREAHLFGARPTALARAHGVSPGLIYAVVQRRAWQHV